MKDMSLLALWTLTVYDEIQKGNLEKAKELAKMFSFVNDRNYKGGLND